MHSIWDFFLSLYADPVLRGPLFTCVAMGAFGGIVGVWLLFQRQTLIGEVLSHSIFPGMIVGAVFSSIASYAVPFSNSSFELASIFLGGFLSAYLGLLLIRFLMNNRLATEDGALSFTLSSTFGFGLFLISVIQKQYPSLWRKLTGFLMGQAATIPNYYVPFSALFFFGVVLTAFFFRRSLASYLFDREFTSLHSLMPRWLEHTVLVTVIVASMIGVRLMGVILMSSILTFPPILARLLSDRLSVVASLSALFGALACGSGVLISHNVASFMRDAAGRSLWLPTGPIVVIVLSFLFVCALLFSPKYGLVPRSLRRLMFSWRCTRENILKFLWKTCSFHGSDYIPWDEVMKNSPLSIQTGLGRLQYAVLKWRGYISRGEKGIYVAAKSLLEGRRLVRLHRLWELYLVEYCGMGKESVHPSAEEMEHILTPEMEQELSMLLNNPEIDPHKQPIPIESEKILLLNRCCYKEGLESEESSKHSS